MCNWTGAKSGWVFCKTIAPLVTNANVFPIEIGYFRRNSRQGRISGKSLDDDQNKPYCTIGPPPQFVSEPHDPASSAISRRRCGSTTTKIRWWPPSLLILRPFRLPTAWPTTTKRGIGSWKAAWQTRGASDSNRRVANRDSGVETLTSGEDAITPHSSNNNTQILCHLPKVGWCAVVICISWGLSLSLSSSASGSWRRDEEEKKKNNNIVGAADDRPNETNADLWCLAYELTCMSYSACSCSAFAFCPCLFRFSFLFFFLSPDINRSDQMWLGYIHVLLLFNFSSPSSAWLPTRLPPP